LILSRSCEETVNNKHGISSSLPHYISLHTRCFLNSAWVGTHISFAGAV
jgi:hypothetical protein